MPASPRTTWQVARPFAPVCAGQCARPSVKAMVTPLTGTGGSEPMSVSDAVTFTVCPGTPPFEVGSSLTNVTCLPDAQVTRATLDGSGAPSTMAVATTSPGASLAPV